MPPGPQHLRVSHLGYASRTLHAFVPTAGSLRINLTLRPDPIPVAGIDIWGTAPLRGLDVQSDGPFPQRGMTLAAVRNHPLLAEPDVLQALGGGEVFLSPESPTGVHIRGGASDQTSYLLDGIPVFSPYHVAGLFSAWNPDALSGVLLSSASPSPSLPDALSGTVAANTRPSSPDFRAQGGISTSNARLTLDGPFPGRGGGYLLSLRWGFPGGVTGTGESSYLRGESGDWLARLTTPLLGGVLGITGYGSRNEIDAAARSRVPEAEPPDPSRNVFRWEGRAAGAEWSGDWGGSTLRVRGWLSSAHAGSTWNASNGMPLRLNAGREDMGLTVEREGEAVGGTTLAGVRIEGSRTSYRVTEGEDGTESISLRARTPVLAGFLHHRQELGRGLSTDLGASLPLSEGVLRVAPRAQLTWEPTGSLTIRGSYARLLQFAQSLRNSESVVGNVFPADLFMGSEAEGVPVAEAHQGVVSLDLRPRQGLRLSGQAYLKASENLLLVAPLEGEPFATGAFAVGSGSTAGLSLEGAWSGTRHGLVATYGWQRVRLEHEGGRFVPQWGAAHSLETGVIFFPTTSSSLRAGLTSVLGRRTTAVEGVLEWESCNLLDRGCEFGGSPHLGDNPRGGTRLPAYVRLDLGAQKHWHLEVAGRDALVSLFGTFTNLMGHRNLLTFATDPATGKRIGAEMRPLSPLVLGLDWRF